MFITNSNNNPNDSILFNTTENKAQNSKNVKNSKESNSGNTLYAGNLNIVQDNIGQKKAFANKKALRTIIDQFNRDLKTDESIGKKEEHISNLKKEASSLVNEKEKNIKSQTELKATYEISDDSDEQKDIELINKAFTEGYSALNSEEREHLSNTFGIANGSDINILKKGLTLDTEKFTSETYERFDNIMSTFTEYQQQALGFFAKNDSLDKKLTAVKYAIEAEDSNLSNFKRELLKSDPMVNAKKVAEDILENASKEIIGMLTQEAVDHIEETKAEEEERAEEQQEKQEELEKLREDKNEDESLSIDDMEYLQQSLNEFEKLQYKIKSEVNANQLLGEDLKGVVVDEGI